MKAGIVSGLFHVTFLMLRAQQAPDFLQLPACNGKLPDGFSASSTARPASSSARASVRSR